MKLARYMVIETVRYEVLAASEEEALSIITGADNRDDYFAAVIDRQAGRLGGHDGEDA